MRRSRLRVLLSASSGPGVLGFGRWRQEGTRLLPRLDPQAQASEPKDSFEMGEQHLNLFPKTTGGLVFGRRGESASLVPGILVNVPWDLAGLRAGAAMRLELARVAIQFGSAVKSHAVGADAAPRGRVDSAVLHQFFASRACVAVAFGIEGEIVAREGSVCPG
jgi:hypothetical protein